MKDQCIKVALVRKMSQWDSEDLGVTRMGNKIFCICGPAGYGHSCVSREPWNTMVTGHILQ